MILTPIGARVLIKRRIIGKLGSLYIPKNSEQMRVCIGEVVEVGDTCEKIKIGDMVTFGRYAPLMIDTSDLEYYGFSKFGDADTEYLLLNEDDVLCLILREETEKQ